LILSSFLSQLGLYAFGKLSVRKQSEFVLIFFMVQAYYYIRFEIIVIVHFKNELVGDKYMEMEGVFAY
jgi:hypothetical protein